MSQSYSVRVDSITITSGYLRVVFSRTSDMLGPNYPLVKLKIEAAVNWDRDAPAGTYLGPESPGAEFLRGLKAGQRLNLNLAVGD